MKGCGITRQCDTGGAKGFADSYLALLLQMLSKFSFPHLQNEKNDSIYSIINVVRTREDGNRILHYAK